MAKMTRGALDGDWEMARRIHRKFLPLMQANFIEPSPLPVKAVLAMMGKIGEYYRLPLVPMKKDTRAKGEAIAAQAALLKQAGAIEQVFRNPQQATFGSGSGTGRTAG